MNTRLLAATVLATALAASGVASAADTAAPSSNLKTVSTMFAFADQNHDGQLTRAEAKGHLPVTASNFDAIDQARRGWISFDQFVAFTNRRAGQQADAVLQVGSWH